VKYQLCLIIIAGLSLTLANCTPEEEVITIDPEAHLTFSTDTLFFDTLFTDTVSFTLRFRVFNPQDNAVNLSSISLASGGNSFYDLLINGIKDKQFQDQVILGKDSLLVLVEVTIPSRDENTLFLVEDSVMFVTNSNIQKVNLVAWGQDAHFFRKDSIIACNTLWPADKPYVLYGSVLVDSLCTLTIEEGAEIYINKNATIFVGGSLQVVGSTDQPVLFRNVRLDLEHAPGQWVGLVFLEGSKNNKIDHAVIRNAEFGVRLGTPDPDTIPDLIISNSIIENMSGYGILAFTSDLKAYNLVVNNCVNATGAHFAGGNYVYQHCTFANYSIGLFNQAPALIFTDNLELDDGSLLQADLYTLLQNNIIWGDHQDKEELLFNASEGPEFKVFLENCLIRSQNDDFEVNNNILGTDPDFPQFIDPVKFNYQLDTLSPAQDQGRLLPIMTDLLGNPRDNKPDIGAYERIE
jgi:hypothetical protein